MAVSELPGNPNAAWTVKTHRDAEHDAYIVVSFVNATLVLSVGETVEEVTDSGLKADTPTIFVGLIGEDSIVQVAGGRRRRTTTTTTTMMMMMTRSSNGNGNSSSIGKHY